MMTRMPRGVPAGRWRWCRRQAQQCGPRRHQRPACLLLGQPVQAAIESTAVLVEERLELTEAFQERRPRANYRSPAQSGVRGGGPRFNATSAVLSCPAGGGDRDT